MKLKTLLYSPVLASGLNLIFVSSEAFGQDQEEGTLDYIHYRRDKQDCYLIRNATDA